MRLETRSNARLTTRRYPKGSFIRKKICRFCANKERTINYKDIKLLESFIKERGKMVSCRISGNCARHQRILAGEVKKARFLSLLPYVRY